MSYGLEVCQENQINSGGLDSGREILINAAISAACMLILWLGGESKVVVTFHKFSDKETSHIYENEVGNMSFPPTCP